MASGKPLVPTMSRSLMVCGVAALGAWGLQRIYVAAAQAAEQAMAQGQDAPFFSTLPTATWLAPALLVLSVVAVFLAGGWRAFYGLAASIPFAVVVGAMLGVATIVGTIIPQHADPARYRDLFGGFPVDAVFLSDLFHSWWFNSWMVLLAAGLVIVTVRRRQFTMRTIGFLFAHCGVVILLIGSLIANLAGTEGFLELTAGNSADSFVVTKSGGGVATEWVDGQKVIRRESIPYSLRLDRFELDRYDPEYRLYVYARVRGGEEFEPAPVASWSPADLEKEVKVPGHEAWVRAEAYYPDHRSRARLEEGAGGPALVLRRDDPQSREDLTLEGDGDEAILRDVGVGVTLVEKETPDLAASLDPAANRPRHLVQATFPDGRTEKIDAAEDSEYDLGDGFHLRVGKFYSHFQLDAEMRPMNVSHEFKNPALDVRVWKDGEENPVEGWLFPKMGAIQRGHDTRQEGWPDFSYEFVGGRRPVREWWVAVASARELLRIAQGAVADRIAVTDGMSIPWAGHRPMRLVGLSAKARLVTYSENASEEPKNPVLHLVGREGSRKPVEQALQTQHGSRMEMSRAGLVLVFSQKPNDIRSFTSHVTVIDEGREVLSRAVRVNEPLTYRGYTFYQSNYKEEAPDYSGFQVVTDPGLWFVFVGFLMVCLGIPYILYVQPRLAARRGSEGSS